ncbi:MAG: hypothetical protein BMS9Abin13_430 [Patescibacteria group bacterium]|nr:MAG: hypothetical protein BMS9Abin13_430 [Patescibacteria group bacterium]
MFLDFSELFRDVESAWGSIFAVAQYWAPFVLGGVFWSLWLRYVRTKWISNIKWVMLEVKLPKDIYKSPLAMEVVLNSLYQTQRGQWFEWYLMGRVKNWFSLELVSIEGRVHFFIRTNVIYKNIIEAQIYAQYSTAEIYEVPDYTKYVDYKGKEGEWSLWGLEYKLTKNDAYPIKTYVDYGLDKEGIKEEYKTDPITSLLEFLGSAGKDEQLWIQILVQPTGKRFKKPGKWWGKRDWKDEGHDLVNGIIGKAQKRGGSDAGASFVTLTKGEQNTISAIERSVSKLGFDCGIRGMYLFKGNTFNVANIFSLLGAFRQYGSNDLNGFRTASATSFIYPWQDFKDIRAVQLRKKMFSAYKRRSYFYAPHKRKPFVLNVEELATIYHFPGGVAETPTFGRIGSRKAEPPPDLPT